MTAFSVGWVSRGWLPPLVSDALLLEAPLRVGGPALLLEAPLLVGGPPYVGL
jgi:hypothetical protein